MNIFQKSGWKQITRERFMFYTKIHTIVSSANTNTTFDKQVHISTCKQAKFWAKCAIKLTEGDSIPIIF